MGMQSSPRLAIIGCGAVVQHHLLPALKRLRWLPEVLVDPSAANREQCARLLGGRGRRVIGAEHWPDVSDAFDAAIVGVPHALHGPIGAGLATLGKHVFMEKPLAVTAAECRETLQAAQRSGAIVSVGLLRRYLHVARWTKALIESGTLGEIRAIHAREGFVFNWAISTDALLRRDVACGGVLMDTGAHTIDLLLYWFGELVPMAYQDDSAGGVEADCAIRCELESGGSARIELSRSRNLPNTCRIQGTNGFVEVHLYRNQVIDCSPNVQNFVWNDMGVGSLGEQRFPELFSAELADFKTSLERGERHGVAAAEASRSVAFIERCYAMRRPLALSWAAENADSEYVPPLPAGSRVVITGATGFIGGRLVERLLAQGATISCLIRNFGSATRLARLPVEIRRVDLGNREAVSDAVRGADFVFHCAYDFRSHRRNKQDAANLIEACVAHEVKRFVYLSTISVYEPLPDGPLTEETPSGNRSWAYTRTKLEIEQAVLDAVRDRGLRGTILQPTIVYGPFSKPWTVAPAEMLLFGTVVLPDRGEGLCNAVYVDDVADAMLLAAQRTEAIGERFLVSGPKEVSWGMFFERIAQSLGTDGPVYRPAHDIARENSGLVHDAKLILRNPKKIIQIAVRSGAIRNLLQAGLDAMPKPLYDTVTRLYFGSGERELGKIYLPDPQQLRLYTAMASVDGHKARRLLGYRPRFSFEAGMVATRAYLQWCYGDWHEDWAAEAAPARPKVAA